MSRPGIILIVLLVGFVALAQPGLCPCWLMLDISAHHPHPDGSSIQKLMRVNTGGTVEWIP